MKARVLLIKLTVSLVSVFEKIKYRRTRMIASLEEWCEARDAILNQDVDKVQSYAAIIALCERQRMIHEYVYHSDSRDHKGFDVLEGKDHCLRGSLFFEAQIAHYSGLIVEECSGRDFRMSYEVYHLPVMKHEVATTGNGSVRAFQTA
ncbi:MAG: hypothetical protein V1685_02720 [Parcubacteria group bacterium]